MFKSVIVLPKRAVPTLDTPLSWVMISIATEKDTWPEYDPKNCQKVLRMVFHDTSPDAFGYVNKDFLFTEKQANLILDWVEGIENAADMLVVSCEAGLCRSAAVAAAISNRYFKDDKMFFRPPYVPNMYVYRTLMDKISKRGWKDI